MQEAKGWWVPGSLEAVILAGKVLAGYLYLACTIMSETCCK